MIRISGAFFARARYIAAAILAVAVVAAGAALFMLRGEVAPDDSGGETSPRLVRCLPPRPDDAPYAVIDARGREFPAKLVRALSAGASAIPTGTSPVAALIPIMARADEAVMSAAVREGGLYLCAAFSLTESELKSLGPESVPRRWRQLLPGIIAERIASPRERYEVRLDGDAPPLYLEVDRELGAALIADTQTDIELMSAAAADPRRGYRPEWRDYARWSCHAEISDAGVLSAMFGDDESRDDRDATVRLHARWRDIRPISDDRRLSDASPAGEGEWSAEGLRALAGAEFLNSLAPIIWDPEALHAPDPLIASAGLNLPDPGHSVAALPQPLRWAAEQMERMRLRTSEIRTLLTGPASLSFGGRTQVLWFDLPGLALDVRERGTAGMRLVERFWDTYFGSSQREIDGYEVGGTIDMPFTVTAAAREERAFIALLAPDAEMNDELPAILSARAKLGQGLVGWIFADVAKIGDAIEEIPSLNSLIDGEDRSADDQIAAAAASLEELGRIFIAIEEPTSGRAVWYD